ncbi:MAG: permease-like cell division protein FtsX [Thermodesulfobacteriota bacterium]|nr:permease-like cell division protein FtsX [Thermodesulfobacteriota bacterium]
MGGYFFRQAWQNLKQNSWMNVITLGTITLSLLVFGLFLVIFFNAKVLLEEWRSRIRVTVYLTDSLSADQTARFREKIRGFEEVQEVGYRSKDEALKTLEERLQGRKGLLKGLPRNPLPASLEIKLKPDYQNSVGVQHLLEKLRGDPQVEDLQYGVEWVERFSAFLVLLQVLGLGLGGLLLTSTILVISNTIRLNIYARREEIEIMRLVGATGFFIRTPFYIEGVLQGFFGAFLSLFILFIFFHLFVTEVYDPLKSLLGFFHLYFLTLEQMAAMIIGGVVLGFIGTQVSVGRYLRV